MSYQFRVRLDRDLLSRRSKRWAASAMAGSATATARALEFDRDAASFADRSFRRSLTWKATGLHVTAIEADPLVSCWT